MIEIMGWDGTMASDMGWDRRIRNGGGGQSVQLSMAGRFVVRGISPRPRRPHVQCGTIGRLYLSPGDLDHEALRALAPGPVCQSTNPPPRYFPRQVSPSHRHEPHELIVDLWVPWRVSLTTVPR